ncbi:MAG TPA: ParA family protein [Methanosarcina sp.]|nr:ParA family protein [Methanosarcina sp.]
METKSYVIWNNKGGVGKSTISFHIASVYAEMNPDRDVIVIDMCPQANVSMMLMGGGQTGERNLQSLFDDTFPKTVVGYIADSIENVDINPNDYLVSIHEMNEKLPTNLYLLSGDGNLELIAPLLSERADAKPLSSKDRPWVKVHSILKTLTETQIDEKRPCTYFVDTNPSFSIYTQMAILAGKELLVPINADDSSIFAITGLFNLIWGTETLHPFYGKYTFASKVDNFEIERPKIALLLGNRFTQQKGAAHAFKALSTEATRKMYSEYQKHPDRFKQIGSIVKDQNEFETKYSSELRDFNSAGVVAANQGIPLSKMDKYVYTVYNETIQVSKEQREKCKETIEQLVQRL